MNGQTYEQIAFAYGVSKQRIHYIVKRGLKPRRSVLDDIHPKKLRAAMKRAREGMGMTAIARRYGLTNYQAKKIMEVVK